jgi:hypothetical protein
MNIGICAGAIACTVGVAAAVTGASSGTVASTQGAADFSTPAALSSTLQVGDSTLAAAAQVCDSNAAANCALAGPLSTTEKVLFLPAPTGDAAKDFAILKAAVADTRYDTIDGSAGGKSQAYTIKGMLEVTRSLAIRNLEIRQTSTAYAVRTIYASGGGTPITLHLDNIKIQRGPAGSEATGSASDSAGIWTTNVIPEFNNIELFGGGKGEGLEIVNAPSGHLTDIYVHDITWMPYMDDQNDPVFWKAFTLATLQQAGDWNLFQMLDYDGHTLQRKRIEEQANGIVLDNVTSMKVLRPRIERIQARFSDGQLYPYQSDGITIVSGNQISIRDAKITHVAEGIDVPAFPANAIDISNANVSDAPLFCFKTRGSYDSRNYSLPADSTNVVTVRNSVGTHCGMAAFYAAGGGTAWFENTQAVDTGMGPDGSAAPGIGTVAAYRFMKSTSLPNLDAKSGPIGMHIINATVSNPNSKVMKLAFHSENDPNDKRTYAAVYSYSIADPNTKMSVSTNFTVVDNTATPTIKAAIALDPTDAAANDNVAASEAATPPDAAVGT